MSKTLDGLLAGLCADTPPSLAGIEDGLWKEIHRRQQAQSLIRGEVGRNTGIAAAALLIGVALGSSHTLPAPKPVNITLLLTEVPPASLLE
jgi:hypothetical protein